MTEERWALILLGLNAIEGVMVYLLVLRSGSPFGPPKKQPNRDRSASPRSTRSERLTTLAAGTTQEAGRSALEQRAGSAYRIKGELHRLQKRR